MAFNFISESVTTHAQPQTRRNQRESYVKSIEWTSGNVSHAMRHSWERFHVPTPSNHALFGRNRSSMRFDDNIDLMQCIQVICGKQSLLVLLFVFNNRLCGTYMSMFAAAPPKTTKFALRRTTDQTVLISLIVLIARKIGCVFVAKMKRTCQHDWLLLLRPEITCYVQRFQLVLDRPLRLQIMWPKI